VKPDAQRAIASYRKHAPNFERRTRRSSVFRREAVELLELQPGQTVIDVACGTGLNFDALQRGVGPGGRVVGVDVSPEMLSVAHHRVDDRGYWNVVLHESDAKLLDLGLEADAALFSLAHDVLRSEAALTAVLRTLRPGARVAAFGAKWAPRWNLPVRLSVWRRARPYVTTFEGFERPWDKLDLLIDDLRVREVAYGSAFLAWGTVDSARVAACR
jgi:ubiquinone/menaquinone biosynthesis C-methylase UbiE